MLKFYRKNIKIIIWLIVLAFAIWGAGSLSVSKDSISSNVGTVGREKISAKEFMIATRYFELLTRAREAQMKAEAEKTAAEKAKAPAEEKPQEKKKSEKNKEKTKAAETKAPEKTETPKAPEPISEDQIKSFAWQMIVLSREAKRAGIAVSDEEVQNEIRRLFSHDGGFDPNVYESWIQNNFHVPVRDFEETIRRHIASDKMRQKILKDVPEDKQNSKWLEWLIPVMSKSHLKELDKPTAA